MTPTKHIPGLRLITCGGCRHAVWSRTPTGRIKQGVAGRCSKGAEYLAALKEKQHPPCIALGSASIVSIWPDFNANACPKWEPLK